MTDALTSTTTSTLTQKNTAADLVNSASDGADRLISSDFETFLKMLTAQLENQDPLNPLQSTDFAVQLATFSGVEQQVLTNDRLATLSSNLNASNLSALSGWIGTEVLAEGPAAYLGTSLDLETKTSPGTASAELQIQDSSGAIIFKTGIPASGGALTLGSGGISLGALPPGTYSFATVSFDSEGNTLGTIAASAYQRVVEVRMAAGAPLLSLAGGNTVTADTISALRGGPT